MSLLCITSHELVNMFLNMSLETIEFDNYTQVNKACSVIVVDENGLVDQNLLRYLIEMSCKIHYICGEDNVDTVNYLISNNQFNVYINMDIHSLTAKDILEISKSSKTKEDVCSTIQSTGKVFSMSSTIEAMTSFIDAIDSKNVDLISEIFTNHFEDFKNMKGVIDSNLLEVDSVRNEMKHIKLSLETKNKEYQELDEKFGNLIVYGKQCEDDNQRLSQELVASKNSIYELETKLSSANSKLDELLLSVQDKDSELQDSRELIDSLKLNLSNSQAKTKQLTKANDLLKESINSIKSIPEDTDVSITSMGSVGKIMYIKMIDVMPYWLTAFKYYQKYNGGTNKNSTGLVLIVPKNSTLSAGYISQDKANLISSNTVYKDCEKSIYVMEGYSSDIKKYIEECGCQSVIVMDYTYSETVFLKSINQVDLYGVNSKNSYITWGIAPKLCLSQARVEGVPCRLPFVDNYDSLSPIDRISIYKDSVFTFLDKCWW